MSIESVLRIAFWLFIGSLAVMQVYFAYRIRQAKGRVGRDVTSDNEPRMSYRASFRFALFLTIFYVFLMIWAAYNTWTGRFSVFLGAAFVVGAIVFIREPLALARKYRPVAVGFSTDLPIESALIDNVTPEYIAGILDKESVINAIKSDLSKTGQIGYKELWRLGLITPDLDRFNPHPEQLSRRERLKKGLEDYNYRLNRLDQIPLEKTAVLQSTNYFNVQFNNLVITKLSERPSRRGHSLRSYGLSTKMKKDDSTPIRAIQIHPGSAETRSRFLPKFLQEDGFPIKESYEDGDPLTTERGGIIVIDKGKAIIITPKYFVQRRLIDDEGNLVYLGLDENFNHSTMFEVRMQPSVSELLLRCIYSNGYLPILRYRSFPYASDSMLPILDTPMSDSGWADLFVDTSGKAKLFIAKEKTVAEWYEMMNRLRQLFFDELARKDYHLLGLTKDKVHLDKYLAKKLEILANYYIIQDRLLF